MKADLKGGEPALVGSFDVIDGETGKVKHTVKFAVPPSAVRAIDPSKPIQLPEEPKQ